MYPSHNEILLSFKADQSGQGTNTIPSPNIDATLLRCWPASILCALCSLARKTHHRLIVMDGVSAAASILAVVEVAGKISSWTYQYAKGVAHAAEKARNLSAELGALCGVLLALKSIESSEIFNSILPTLQACEVDLT